MIDYFALGLIHFLIVIIVIRLSGRDDLDEESVLSGDRDDRRKRTAGDA